MITLSNGYRFEAEELSLGGFRVEWSSTAGASSDKFVATRHYSGATGNAAGTFAGDAGTYRVEVGYYDENDGQSLATVTVDGQAMQFRFDQDLGGSGAAVNTHATRITHQALELQPGDPFSVAGRANGSEYARFDYIDFIRLDAVNPPAPPPDGNTGLEAFEAEVVRLLNVFRAENGKNSLTVDAALTRAAEEHSEDMALHDLFSHTGSDGAKLGTRISDEGYGWRAIGENIAAGQTTPQAVIDAWKGSSGHRANMLGSWEDVGVGYEYLANDTGTVNYHHYWTMDFGTPSDALLA